MPHHGQHRAPHSHLTAPSFPAPRGAHGWHPPPALVPSGQGTWAQLRPPSAACRASSSSCLEKNNFRQGGEGKGDNRRRRGWRETLLGCRHAPLGIHHRLGPPLPRHTQALSPARLTAGPSPARQLRHTKSRSEQWSRAAQPSQLPPPAPSTPEGSAGRRAHRWVFRDPPCRCRDTRQPQPHRTALPLRNALPAAGSPSPDPHPRGLGCVLPCGSTEPCPAVPTVERGRRPSLPSWGRQLLQGPRGTRGSGRSGVVQGQAKRFSLPPPPHLHSPFFLKKARSEERFLPMKTTMVARRRVCSPREGAPPPPIAPGGGCRDRSSFSPRSSVPQDRLQDARREDARPAERLRGERPEPGGDARRQEGTARLLPARSRCWEEESRAPPLASRSPRPSPPSCTKRAGTHPAWHGAECREFPPNSCARGGIPPHHPHQSGLVPTGHSSPANRRAGLHSTVVNWEELGGISPPSINLWDLLQQGR